VSDSLNNISSSGFTLCADHGGAFANTTEGFTKVAAAADEGNTEGVLLDVVGMVGWGEDFGFVNVVYADGFEDLFQNRQSVFSLSKRIRRS